MGELPLLWSSSGVSRAAHVSVLASYRLFSSVVQAGFSDQGDRRLSRGIRLFSPPQAFPSSSSRSARGEGAPVGLAQWVSLLRLLVAPAGGFLNGRCVESGARPGGAATRLAAMRSK